jgi:LacI family transcriptional regulator
MMAVGAMRGALELGVKVPDDLSLIGFDDIALARAMSPALTTMAQPVPEMARRATEVLIARMKGEVGDQPRQRIVLPARLVIRDSCSRWAGEE